MSDNLKTALTDAEIKKALECCSTADCHRSECPVFNETVTTADCITMLSNFALDLINRKEEMIDGLIAGQETLQKALAEKQAEIERVTLEYAGFEAATKQFVKELVGDAE